MRGGEFCDRLNAVMETVEIKTENLLKEMFEKGMHLGYSQTSRHPKIQPYLFGVRNGVEIFDLAKTRICLDVAKNFIKNAAKEGKTILFVGTKKEAKQEVEKAAKELNMPYVKERWVGGTLTNFKEIRSRINYFIGLKVKKDSGELEKYTKKERLRIEKGIQKMERYLGGLENLTDCPSALVVIDSKHEKIGVEEAVNRKIPVVALINSDCDPTNISYPVPANDSSLSSIVYFLAALVKEFKEGVEMRAAEAKEKEVLKIEN